MELGCQGLGRVLGLSILDVRLLGFHGLGPSDTLSVPFVLIALDWADVLQAFLQALHPT